MSQLRHAASADRRQRLAERHSVANAPKARLSGAAPAQHLAPLLRLHAKPLLMLLVGIVIVGAPVFARPLIETAKSDHRDHVQFVQRAVETGVWPAHFLFQAVIYGVSGFSTDYNTLAVAALVVLVGCVALKGWASYLFLASEMPVPTPAARDRAGRLSAATLLLLVTAALLLAAPVVRPWQVKRIYLGQISPNLWHNPTSLVCWPTAILMFFAAERFLQTGRARFTAAIGGLAAVGVLAKPNYLLAFAPVFCLLAAWQFRFSWRTLLAPASLAPAVLILAWQWMASFTGPAAMRPDRHVAWLPWAAWSIHSRSIPLSLLFSLAFPLSYVICFRNRLVHRQRLLFAWGVMACALAWTACFAEVSIATGEVDTHFNFSWGAHLAAFVLFLATAVDLLANRDVVFATPRAASDRWARLPWYMLGAHAASGAFWIARQACGYGFY